MSQFRSILIEVSVPPPTAEPPSHLLVEGVSLLRSVPRPKNSNPPYPGLFPESGLARIVARPAGHDVRPSAGPMPPVADMESAWARGRARGATPHGAVRRARRVSACTGRAFP